MVFSISETINKMQKKSVVGDSFLGVDIGSSSTKIVQLAIRDNVVTLETYGEISNAPYADPQPGKLPETSAQAQSAALADLLHEVNAMSRICGVAVPLSETLTNTVDMPKRDPEQMRKIIPVEAKEYIPVPVESVMLDWYVLPQEEKSAFDTIAPKTQVEAQFQKVMIIAITHETAGKIAHVVSEAALASQFYEIEMFSMVRACARSADAPALILDLGATTSKAYTVNERWDALTARPIPIGGKAITGSLMKALSYDLPTAERAKCEHGLTGERAVTDAISAALAPIWTYVQQILEEHKKQSDKPIKNILLAGGGAYMPGIVELVSGKFSLPVQLVHAFDRTKGPMILENALKEDGPRFAVAVGLALRGIGK